MRGYSLLELLTTLSLLGLLAALGGQRLGQVRDELAVHAAVTDIVLAYQRARLEALRTASPVRFEITHARITGWWLSDRDSSLAWSAPGPGRHGVVVRERVGPVVMSPAGITLGVANGRYVVERGSAHRAVIASRLGRLRVARPRRRQSRSCSAASAGTSSAYRRTFWIRVERAMPRSCAARRLLPRV